MYKVCSSIEERKGKLSVCYKSVTCLTLNSLYASNDALFGSFTYFNEYYTCLLTECKTKDNAVFLISKHIIMLIHFLHFCVHIGAVSYILNFQAYFFFI